MFYIFKNSRIFYRLSFCEMENLLVHIIFCWIGWGSNHHAIFIAPFTCKLHDFDQILIRYFWIYGSSFLYFRNLIFDNSFFSKDHRYSFLNYFNPNIQIKIIIFIQYKMSNLYCKYTKHLIFSGLSIKEFLIIYPN